MSSLYYVDSETPDVPVKVGVKAPDFTLLTERGEPWRLSENRGEVTVLLFYPGSETIVCARQLCSIRENWQAYLRTRARIVGISGDKPEASIQFSQQWHLPIPLLTDPDLRITKLFAQHWLIPVSLTRGVIVIDADGYIRNREVMLRALRPSDEQLIKYIYAARHEAPSDTSGVLRTRLRRMIDRKV
jgi:peroxiredoxin